MVWLICSGIANSQYCLPYSLLQLFSGFAWFLKHSDDVRYENNFWYLRVPPQKMGTSTIHYARGPGAVGAQWGRSSAVARDIVEMAEIRWPT